MMLLLQIKTKWTGAKCGKAKNTTSRKKLAAPDALLCCIASTLVGQSPFPPSLPEATIFIIMQHHKEAPQRCTVANTRHTFKCFAS